MRTHLLKAFALTAVILLLMPSLASAKDNALTTSTNYGLGVSQVPTLGAAKDFVLFSTAGAVSNVGSGTLTLLTGNVGTNGSTVTSNFGNVDGIMHDNDAASAAASTALLTANSFITGLTKTADHLIGFGGGEILPAGIYLVGGASTLNGILTLNGSATDVFIFKIGGSLSIATNSQIVLTGGATACNVFFQTDGFMSMATGANLKGTFIANNGAITMDGVILEGRALSITGAVTVSGITARIPIGCASPNLSPTLMGPGAPTLNSTECFVYLSGNGNVTGTVPTALFTGDIGTNVGLTSGFTTSNVTGFVHPVPDPSTNTATGDLLTVYNYLNGLVPDITLLYPVDFGKELVLTPHTYIMNSAAVLTGKLYLNAQNNANAVFVINITGAFSTAAGAEVVLLNGALAKNVYWRVKDGAVSIELNNIFKGTIVANAGAIDLKAGVTLSGRAMTLTGTITSAAASAIMPPGCLATGLDPVKEGNANGVVMLYPNPFNSYTNIEVSDASPVNSYDLRIYNVLGKVVLTTKITKPLTTLETSTLPTGIYFYKMVGKNKAVKSGKLISQQ